MVIFTDPQDVWWILFSQALHYSTRLLVLHLDSLSEAHYFFSVCHFKSKKVQHEFPCHCLQKTLQEFTFHGCCHYPVTPFQHFSSRVTTAAIDFLLLTWLLISSQASTWASIILLCMTLIEKSQAARSLITGKVSSCKCLCIQLLLEQNAPLVIHHEVIWCYRKSRKSQLGLGPSLILLHSWGGTTIESVINGPYKWVWPARNKK